MSKHTVTIICSEPYHDGRPAVVERFTLALDPPDDGVPGGWRLIPGHGDVRREPGRLDRQNRHIKPPGVLGPPQRADRHTYDLRCKCGLATSIRDDRLEGILTLAAAAGLHELPLSQFGVRRR